MAAKDEGGNEGMLGGLREMVQLLQEMISQVSDDSDHDVGQGGENKLNSDETSDEQGTRKHQLAGLSATYNALLAYKKSDQVGDSDAVRDQVGDSDLASKYNLPDDEEVTNPIDYSSSDYDAIRDHQLQEQFSQLSIEKDDSKELPYDASLKQYLSKIDSSTSDHHEAEQAQYGAHEHASDLTLDVTQPVNPEKAPPKPRLQRQNAMQRQRYTSELDPGYSASSLKQYMSKIDSSSSDHLEAEQAQYGTHEHASGFTFDVKQPVNPEKAPPKPRLQRQNAMQRQRYTREQPVNPEQAPPKPILQRQNAMRRQRHTSELDPGYSASYLNQPMPTRIIITTESSLAPYAYASVNLFGTSSDNVEDSWFGNEGGVSRNHLLPSLQRHQSGDSNVWRPSSRRSQRQQQLRSAFLASLNQQNDRSDDPSD